MVCLSYCDVIFNISMIEVYIYYFVSRKKKAKGVKIGEG